jgi:hypothetical protein
MIIARSKLMQISPVTISFIASLVLSFIAVQNHLINRDGILYLELAHLVQIDGLSALRGDNSWLHQWPFFSVVIALSGKLTGLSLETMAQLLNALFMAGSCALIVEITRHRWPEASWAACLAVLAMPAFNEYRSDILREHGFWFFSILALWLAIRWDQSPSWRHALLCQFAILIAALFRLEALAFYAALVGWQSFAAPTGHKLRRIFMLVCLPLAGTAILFITYGIGAIELPSRSIYYLEAANPFNKLRELDRIGKQISDAGFFTYKYSREEAGYILFFGLLSVIPVKFVQMSGVLLIPLLYQLSLQPLKRTISDWQPMAWAFVIYAAILAAFITHMFFLTGRYVSLLNLLAVPLVAAGLAGLMARFKRWRILVYLLLFITMASNVISTSNNKGHILEAGEWLAANVNETARVYIENPRVAYYSGLGQRNAGKPGNDRHAITQLLAENRYDFVVLDKDKSDATLDEWFKENRMIIINSYMNKKGDSIVIAVPTAPDGRN